MTRRGLIAALLVGALPIRVPRQVTSREDELTSLTAGAVAAGVARGDLSAVELTEAYLARIARVDPELGAFVTVTPERAEADAHRRRSGPLAGVPVAHKDLFETAGIRTAAGSRLFEAHVPARDAAAVRRLAEAGAVLLGKTNTHELGGGVTTINPFYGTTRNPADRSRIAGGSSGGSAAAVAARLSVVATGSDTGGSVRIPAALCGTVGFMPTFGRVDTSGLLGACPTFDHVGVLSRTAADAALVFRVLAGVRAPARPAPRPIRVGVARGFFFDDLAPDVDAAMTRAIGRFQAIGAEVDDRLLPVDDRTMARVFDPIVSAEIWARYGRAWRERPNGFSPAFGAFFNTPPPAPADVLRSRQALATFQREVDAAFGDLDVIMTPAVPVTAPPIVGPIDAGRILRNTWPFNAARTPAISVPCGTDRAGLPIGLQLTARRGQDERLLAVAGRFLEESGL